MVIPLVPSIVTLSVELPTVTTPSANVMVSTLFSLIVIPLVPLISTWSVALPMVTTPPVTSKTSALLVNIDIELFSITTLSWPVVPPVLRNVNVPPVITVSEPNVPTSTPPCVIVNPLELTTALLLLS